MSVCWVSLLQFDWQSPVWRHFLAMLGDLTTTVRYDERSFGLSDWDVADFPLEARVHDLEAIADQLPYDRFALMGMSAGALVAIEYAARHPQRVSRLVLYGPVLSGCFAVSAEDRVEEAMLAAIRAGWVTSEDQRARRHLCGTALRDSCASAPIPARSCAPSLGTAACTVRACERSRP